MIEGHGLNGSFFFSWLCLQGEKLLTSRESIFSRLTSSRQKEPCSLSPAFLSSRRLAFDLLLLSILDLMTDDYPDAAG